MQNDKSKFILYTAPSGEIRVDVYLKDETVWLTQKAMAELFGVNVPTIGKYISIILEEVN